jgi:hypothetical protein
LGIILGPKFCLNPWNESKLIIFVPPGLAHLEILTTFFGSQCTGDASAAGEKYAKCLLVNNSKLHCFMQVGLQIICFAAAAGLEVE